MPKVKMSDVKSGSERVKEVFRRIMAERSLRWLQSQAFTNDELVEILELSQNIERHNDHRKFYQRLINSQKGPFNLKTFIAFRDIVFDDDALINLIKNSEGVGDADKARWMDYTFVTSHYWFLPNFYMNGEAEKVGVDVMRKPFNMSFAVNSVQYEHKLMRDRTKEEKEFLWKVLDTLTESEQLEWYNSCVAQTYQNKALKFLTEYKNTSADVIKSYYFRNRDFGIRSELVMHPNCPPELRNEMYEQTKDEKFLPEAIKDIFLF